MKKHTLWFSGEIVDVSPAGRNLFLLTVTAPPALPEPSPGTFAMIKLGKNRVPLLPRPLSILDYRDGTLIFLFRVVGEGTLLLSLARSGDPVEISAPLGNGFPHPDSLGTGD
ncbi:hypothetical protein KKF84_12005, partial [Myxococcota bacterium]|nr:hypothetical protein [Myxococcota bacterium]MBU1536037.1 hypothetical protein [Myxococcota bacterium]